MSRPRAEQPKFSLTLRSGRYYVQWWEDGGARRISCRTEILTNARRFLAEFKAARRAPIVPAAPTIGAILSGYVTDRENAPHSPTLAYASAALRRHLADLPADLLTRAEVRGYMEARRREGAGGAAARHRKRRRPISDGTLIRELGVLRRALAWAVEEKWIATAPHVERPEAPPPRDRWLTRAEADRLIAGARASHVRLFIVLALQTAARTGALLELTWAQVDLVRGLIMLGRGRGRKRRATVPVTDEARVALEIAAHIATSDYVIEHGGTRVASVKTGFRAAVQRAGIVGITPHALRHTAATWMVQAGVPVATVAAYLGNSAQMVDRVYGHHSPDHLRSAGAALSRQMAETTSIAKSEKI